MHLIFSQMTLKYIILSIFRKAVLLRALWVPNYIHKDQLLCSFLRNRRHLNIELHSVLCEMLKFLKGFPNRQFLFLLKNDIDFTSMDE